MKDLDLTDKTKNMISSLQSEFPQFEREPAIVIEKALELYSSYLVRMEDCMK